MTVVNKQKPISHSTILSSYNVFFSLFPLNFTCSVAIYIHRHLIHSHKKNLPSDTFFLLIFFIETNRFLHFHPLVGRPLRSIFVEYLKKKTQKKYHMINQDTYIQQKKIRAFILSYLPNVVIKKRFKNNNNI